MNEPLAEVLKFCAWYLERGAHELVICFDNPDDPAIARLTGHPRIRAIPCTAAFWGALDLTPDVAFVTRQNAALTWIYHQYPDGWLLNVDADEFLYLVGRDVADLLAEVPAEKKSLRVRTAERVLTEENPTCAHFRLPMARPVRRAVYGEDAPLFGPRREGLVGHSHGKSFVRSGIRGLALRQHWPRGLRDDGADELVLGHQDRAYLLHMIGARYDIWRDKVTWRSASRGFTTGLTERIAAAQAAPAPEEALRDLHRRLHAATPARLSALRARDVLLTVPLELDALAEAHFGA